MICSPVYRPVSSPIQWAIGGRSAASLFGALFSAPALPTGFTFTRASGAVVTDNLGVLRYIPNDVPGFEGMRLSYELADGATLGPELFGEGALSSSTGVEMGAGWSVSGGVGVATGASGTIGKSFATAAGKMLQLEFDVVTYVSGSGFKPYIADTPAAIAEPFVITPGHYKKTSIAGVGIYVGVWCGSGNTTGSVDNISIKEIIPIWLSTDIAGNPLVSQGVINEPAMTNKLTCRKVNPVDTAGLTKSGDILSVLSVVDDTAALAAAGLSAVCTSGKVYKLDNSAGVTSADVNFNVSPGNTNKHSTYLCAGNW